MKKTPGDITILHTCTKNYDQMMYGSLDVLRNGQMDGKNDIQRWVLHLKRTKFVGHLKLKLLAFTLRDKWWVTIASRSDYPKDKNVNQASKY